jgi:hypothetical protein
MHFRSYSANSKALKNKFDRDPWIESNLDFAANQTNVETKECLFALNRPENPRRRRD